MKWDECKMRSKHNLNIARWKLTSPSERAFCPLIPAFYIMAVAKLCDLIGAEIGLVYDEKHYAYEKPKLVKGKKRCRLAGRIKYEEKFEL